MENFLGLGFLFVIGGFILSLFIVIAFFSGVRYLKEISSSTHALQIMVENEIRRRDRQPSGAPVLAHR
jgi:hypothetical protein